MGGTRIDLDLQIVQIRLGRCRLWMGFRIAGTEDGHIRALGMDIGHQVAGMIEYTRRGPPLHTVPAQRKNRCHTGPVEHIQGLVNNLLVGVLGRKVGHGGNAVLGMNGAGDPCCGCTVGLLARAVGYGYEIRHEPLKTIQGIVDGPHRRIALRRKHFQREYGLMHDESSLLSPADRPPAAIVTVVTTTVLP